MKTRSVAIDESSSGRLLEEDEFERIWPPWQEGLESRRLVCVQVHESFEALFRALFQTHSRFQSEAQDARRYTNVQETNWTWDYSDLPTSSSFQWPLPLPLLSERCPQEGMMRKVLLTCPGNAMHPGAFRAEQVERCVELIPGRKCVVDVCVISSPMYCDKFRPVVRYTIERMGQKKLKLTVDTQIIYVSKVNVIVKGFIERSARNGMEDSFRKWQQALEAHFIGAVVDLTTAAASTKQRRPLEAQSDRSELKSHRLEDVPLEIVEEEMNAGWAATFSRSDNLALLLLALILPILRLAWLLLSLPSEVMTSLVATWRRAKSCLTPQVFVQVLLMLVLTAVVFDLSARPHSFIATALDSAYCTPWGAVLCISFSFSTSVILQYLLKL